MSTDAIIANIADALVVADPVARSAFIERVGEIMDENERLRARLDAQALAYNSALDRADKRMDDASKAATERLAQVIAERDEARAQVDELLETLSRTCETPVDNCQCTGCFALREHADIENAEGGEG